MVVRIQLFWCLATVQYLCNTMGLRLTPDAVEVVDRTHGNRDGVIFVLRPCRYCLDGFPEPKQPFPDGHAWGRIKPASNYLVSTQLSSPCVLSTTLWMGLTTTAWRRGGGFWVVVWLLWIQTSSYSQVAYHDLDWDHITCTLARAIHVRANSNHRHYYIFAWNKYFIFDCTF